MPEDTWMKTEREYFVDLEADSLGIKRKDLNEAILKYNKFIQKSLLGESPFVAEDLKNTIQKAGGEIE